LNKPRNGYNFYESGENRSDLDAFREYLSFGLDRHLDSLALTLNVCPPAQQSAQRFPEMRRLEIELLLCCARTEVDSEMGDRIKSLLQQTIDWEFLIQTSCQHGTISLLHKNLETICPDAIPRAARSRLQRYYDTNALRNRLLTKELLVLLSVLKDNDIPAIPFKGAVLSAAIYGSPSFRKFSDLDILVRKQDVPTVKNLLLAQGYQLGTEHGWQQEWFNPSKAVIVDLHWELTPSFTFPFKLPKFESLWQRTRLLWFETQTVIDFSWDDLLIILALQVTRSGYEDRQTLMQICDLAELIRIHQTLDWPKLLQQSRTLGIERPLWISLLLIQKVLQCKLPDEIRLLLQQKMQRDPAITIFCVRMQKRLFLSDQPSPRFIKDFFQFILQSGPHSQMPQWMYLSWQFVRYIIHYTMIDTTPTDRKFCPLPPELSFLYLLIRPVRLMGHGLNLLFKTLNAHHLIAHHLNDRPRINSDLHANSSS
jgi:hypothetical protein